MGLGRRLDLYPVNVHTILFLHTFISVDTSKACRMHGGNTAGSDVRAVNFGLVRRVSRAALPVRIPRSPSGT